MSRSVLIVSAVLALFAAALALIAAPARGQVRKDGDGLVPNVDFPDRYDIFDEPFPDRPVTPLAEVVRMGRGPIPMVLIPGVGSDWTIWRGFMERNSGLYSMYAITLPGFGGSTPPPAGPEEDFGNLPYLRNAVKAILELIDGAKLEKPVLIGHGMGGHLALWIGARYPEKTRAVISLDGAPLVPFANDLVDNDRGVRRETIGRTMFRPLTMDGPEGWDLRMESTAFGQVTDGERAQQIKKMYLNCFRGTFVVAQFEYMMSDLRKPLAKMQVPTLMVAPCAPDQPGGPGFLRQRWLDIINDCTNSTFMLMRDSRHFVMDDQPEQLDNLLRRFVYGLPIDDAFVSAAGTAKPVNPELERKAQEAEKDAAPQKP